MIRKSKQTDIDKIAKLMHESFSSEAESNLVKKLFSGEDILVNLVYQSSDQILGNIIISKIKMHPDVGLFCGGVGPLAVRPSHQFKGIGSQLMKAAIIECSNLGVDALFVLGDPNYYKRFNFEVSKIRSDYNAKNFQELQLTGNCLNDLQAKISYADAFSTI
tara:strand:+ start:25 stop:510 length:486 start_codon:yes stop_codon:yes gene_type:complete